MTGDELPKALHDQLSRDTLLCLQLSRFDGRPAVFYSTVPERAELPYVVIGATTGYEPRDSKLTRGAEITREVFVIGDDEGNVEKISERVRELLHRAPLVVRGYSVLASRVVEGPRRSDVEGAYARVMSARVWIQEARS